MSTRIFFITLYFHLSYKLKMNVLRNSWVLLYPFIFFLIASCCCWPPVSFLLAQTSFFLVFLFLELLRCAWGNLLSFLFSTKGKLKNHWVNFCFETLLFCFEVFLWGKHEKLLKTYSSVSCLLQVFSPSLHWGRMQKLFMSVSKIKDFFNLVFLKSKGKLSM